MSSGFSIVLTTTNSQDSVEKIVAAALRDELAACIQTFPVVSHYTWKGALQREDEILLQMKTRTELYARLSAAIRAVHPYQTPEIVRLDIAEGDQNYLDWIATETAGGG